MEADLDELIEEKEILTHQLSALEKEIFELDINISSWQKTLTRRLSEFQEAESYLDKLYKEIWLERENFCATSNDGCSKTCARYRNEVNRDKPSGMMRKMERMHNLVDSSGKCDEQIRNEVAYQVIDVQTGREPLASGFEKIENREHKIYQLEGSKSQNNSTNEKNAQYSAHVKPKKEVAKYSPNKLFTLLDVNKMRMMTGKRRINIKRSN